MRLLVSLLVWVLRAVARRSMLRFGRKEPRRLWPTRSRREDRRPALLSSLLGGHQNGPSARAAGAEPLEVLAIEGNAAGFGLARDHGGPLRCRRDCRPGDEGLLADVGTDLLYEVTLDGEGSRIRDPEGR